MKIIFNDNNSQVQSAADAANTLLDNADFYNAIIAHGPFDMSNVPADYIANAMKTSVLQFTVKIFYIKWWDAINRIKYAKTLAFADPNVPNTLFLLYNKLNRTLPDLAATMIHESIHALDDSNPADSFGHGDNKPDGKENTAPYWIGNLAFRMIGNTDGNISNFNEIESS